MRKLMHLAVASILWICVFGLSACSDKKSASNSTLSTQGKPSILFIVLDTLRPDHLSGYGYKRKTSPNLDEFADKYIKYEHAITAAPWTPASIASMITGLYPLSHGMMPPDSREEARKRIARLSSSLETLPEILAKNGYATSAVSPNPWISKEFGFDQGYQHFRYLHRANADRITDAGLEALTELQASPSPFFLYLHYFDPHHPYQPSPEFAAKFTGDVESHFEYSDKMKGFINLYDAEINFMDQELGRLFTELKRRNMWDSLLIVIVGDHGEQFMEHGNHQHGFKLYNEEVRVPLYLKTDSAEESKRHVDTVVSTVDIFPTILSKAGIPLSKKFPGVSLLNEAELRSRTGVLSEIKRRYSQKSFTNPEGKKIILEVPIKDDMVEIEKSLERWKNPDLVGIYDVLSDPNEVTALSDSALYAELRELFEAELVRTLKLRLSVAPEDAKVSDDTLDQLKSLGYL